MRRPQHDSRPVSRPRLIAISSLLAILVAGAGPARAQTPDTPPAIEPVAATRVSEVASEVDRLRSRLADKTPVVALDSRLMGVERWIAQQTRNLSELDAGVIVDPSRLEELQLAIDRQRQGLDELGVDLAAAIDATEAMQREAGNHAEFWARNRDAIATMEGTDDIDALVASLDTDIETVVAAARERLARFIALESRKLRLEREFEDLARQTRDLDRAMRAAILERRHRPLWSAVAHFDDGGLREHLEQTLDRVESGFRDLLATYSGRATGHAVITIVLLLTILATRRTRSWRDEPEFAAIQRVIERPFAVTALLALAFVRPIYPTAQPAVFAATGMLFVIVELLVLRALMPRISAGALWLAGIYLIVAKLSYLLPGGTPLQRLLLLVVSLGGAGLLIAAWRVFDRREDWQRWRGRPVARLAFAASISLLVIAGAANLAGILGLAILLTESVLDSILAALGLLTLVLVLRDLVGLALHIGPLSRLRSISRHVHSIKPRLRGLLSGLAVILWVWATLVAFGVNEPVSAAFRWIFAAGFQVGQTTIVPGTILVLGLAIWLALYVSRIIRFFFDDDVAPRLSLPRGVPGAISTTLHYVIIGAAVIIGTNIVGLDLTKLTIVFGALGVGIGFGLQNIINNFVSGLILLFERPVQVGDNVQVGALMGTVKRIGIRASVVRTYEGSEVIVPNGDLISQQVINYTLSDRNRRLEVLVGIAYGSDLDRAHDVIAAAVADVELVQTDPEPMILFEGFGESSLDFRVLFWIADFDHSLTTRSDVGRRIEKALKEAGFTIPFPQRDVHMYPTTPPEPSDR